LFVWRLTRKDFQALDGEGARLNGGRWNSEGWPVVYASTTLSLAVLEHLVPVDPEDMPDDLVAMRIHVPDDLSATVVRPSDLPADWNRVAEHPAGLAAGESWLVAGDAVLLRVPSAVVAVEDNILINLRHAEAARIVVEGVSGFSFDRRLR
jgi:RES domain-containing protein